jgi:hypothetical protein
MSSAIPLADHLAPDTVNRLERAAEVRHDDALILLKAHKRLCAVYLFGYCVEMCLAAAYFRAAGFSAVMVIDRETRKQRMARARQLQSPSGEYLMSADPHPLVGWARYLEWQRSTTPLSPQERDRLKDAVEKADLVYRHWRPELRYKITEAKPNQVAEVRKASEWFLRQRGRL